MKLPLPRSLANVSLREPLQRLRRELGFAGQLALALLVLSAIFYKAALEPLQGRAQRLSSEVERHAGQQTGRSGSAASKLETFYAYLGRDERTTDWLAKLYAIGKATGVELQSANYRTVQGGEAAAANAPAANGAAPAKAPASSGRIEHYEIVLPVTGTYAQMRDFLQRALTEIPVLSLDQMTLKRESRNDGAVHAELKLTLHSVKK